MSDKGQTRVLAVDDNEDALFALEELLKSHGYDVITAVGGNEAITKARREFPDTVLLDINMPDRDGISVLREIKSDPLLRFTPVVLLTANDSLEDVTQGLDEGADDYIIKPFRSEELLSRVGAAVRMRKLYARLRTAESESVLLRRRLADESSFSNIVGKSKGMREVFDLISKVVDAPVPVLITGESGTGKELIAHALHYQGERRNRPFLAQNCAAFSENLLESELFGHAKGAFTGAVRDREGLFEAADGGTLFLDEIGELAPTLQAKLLRVLQDGTFSRVGETKARKVDVRIVAATNRDLKVMVKEGKFREDLFYRLNVVRVHLPPLRERKEDIPLLIEHFLNKGCHDLGKGGKRLSNDALKKLLEYSWPGNIRELKNEIERAVLLSGDDSEIGASLLSEDLREASGSIYSGSEGEQTPVAGSLKEAVLSLEKKMIEDALAKTGGNKSEAARVLGVSRSNLIAKAQSFGLD